MKTKKIILTTLTIIALIISLSYIFFSRYGFIKSMGKQCFVQKDFNSKVGDIVYVEDKDKTIRYSARVLAQPGDKFNFDILNKVFTINGKEAEINFDQTSTSDILLKTMKGDLPENTYLVYPEHIDISFNTFSTKMYIKKENIVAKNIFCF